MPIRLPDILGFRAAREVRRLQDITRSLTLDVERHQRQAERWRSVADAWQRRMSRERDSFGALGRRAAESRDEVERLQGILKNGMFVLMTESVPRA